MCVRSKAIDETRWNRNVLIDKALQTYNAPSQLSAQIQHCFQDRISRHEGVAAYPIGQHAAVATVLTGLVPPRFVSRRV